MYSLASGFHHNSTNESTVSKYSPEDLTKNVIYILVVSLYRSPPEMSLLTISL